ncbi:uncharacterized protein F4822DRAFT_428717 [Hypoxylon trugodes]|uniref:uncharacterized protein n=1 Tax=Hypoxylon trugodes TaxID=326681 RepID=UPI0021941CF1|nr:uncharacterized protein F4822DRAFT_428717 [Hypoxylon trugodes]KAI1390380.1 hypothetical protein F4822DRAFT_428717 [Hypoxylon trugodes]
MSSNHHREQPGLELAPEPELPHVVEGPTIVEKPYDGSPQFQPAQAAYYQNNAYANGGYSPSAYPTHPGLAPQGQPYWGGSQDGTYLTDGSPPSNTPPKDGMILGIRKKKFWLIIGPLIALVVIGLAVGLGAGLGTSHNKDSTSSPPAAPDGLPCNQNQSNGTVYETDNEKFLILCNRDYNGNGNSGTTDIGNKAADSAEECVQMCAENDACVGAGWGSVGDGDTCWMKGSLGAQQAGENWFFAIKQ